MLTEIGITGNQALAIPSSGKRMVPARQNYDSSHTFARLAVMVACSSMTSLLPARLLLFLAPGVLVIRGLPLFFRNAIAAAEIVRHLRATGSTTGTSPEMKP